MITCLSTPLPGTKPIRSISTKLEPGGTLRIANAGHLAPFCNGKEIQMPGALPLGLYKGAVYEESTVTLEPSDRFTLLSDGVVEAQSGTGELFGFDRTCQISANTAQSIAEQARRFGQTDDITVLTLERVAECCPVPA